MSALAEQVIAGHMDPPARPRPGDLVTVDVDFVYLQDGNSPTIARLFAQHGFDAVFDPGRVAFVFDHTVLVADTAMADRMREAALFAKRLGPASSRAGAASAISWPWRRAGSRRPRSSSAPIRTPAPAEPCSRWRSGWAPPTSRRRC